MVKPSLYSKGAALHRKAHSVCPNSHLRRGKSRHQALPLRHQAAPRHHAQAGCGGRSAQGARLIAADADIRRKAALGQAIDLGLNLAVGVKLEIAPARGLRI